MARTGVPTPARAITFKEKPMSEQRTHQSIDDLEVPTAEAESATGGLWWMARDDRGEPLQAPQAQILAI